MATQNLWLALDQGHRNRLSDLGLSEKQIRGLDVVVLGLRAWLPTGPSMREVKAPLKQVSELVGTTLMTLSPLLAAAAGGAGGAASRDSGNWLYAMASIEGISSDQIESTMRNMAALKQACDQALQKMPVQARSSAASSIPIARIWETLQHHHDHGTQELIRLTSAVGSKLRDICGVCYEAASGRQDATDPERALRAFVKEYRAREKRLRAIDSTVAVVTTTGRQVDDSDYLPS